MPAADDGDARRVAGYWTAPEIDSRTSPDERLVTEPRETPDVGRYEPLCATRRLVTGRIGSKKYGVDPCEQA